MSFAQQFQRYQSFLECKANIPRDQTNHAELQTNHEEPQDLRQITKNRYCEEITRQSSLADHTRISKNAILENIIKSETSSLKLEVGVF